MPVSNGLKAIIKKANYDLFKVCKVRPVKRTSFKHGRNNEVVGCCSIGIVDFLFNGDNETKDKIFACHPHYDPNTGGVGAIQEWNDHHSRTPDQIRRGMQKTMRRFLAENP